MTVLGFVLVERILRGLALRGEVGTALTCVSSIVEQVGLILSIGYLVRTNFLVRGGNRVDRGCESLGVGCVFDFFTRFGLAVC